jgi:hypothetical protein
MKKLFLLSALLFAGVISWGQGPIYDAGGGVVIPSTATGGPKGPGTVNVSSGYYVNGVLTNSAGNNIVMKSNGTNAVASSITDTGTTVSITEPFNAASVSTTPTGGVGGGIAGPEGTVPPTIGGITLPQTGYDGCYFDSATHGQLCSFNNGAFAPFGGSAAFNAITSGTNNSMAGILGTGASIGIGATTVSAYGTNDANGFYQTSFLNNTSTGTILGQTVCFDSSTANTVITCPSNTKGPIVGIVKLGAGTTGYAKVAVRNQATLAYFDATTTTVDGNYAVTSSSAGLLTDTGSTTPPTCGNSIAGIITSVETGTQHTILVRSDTLPACGIVGQFLKATSTTAIGLGAPFSVQSPAQDLLCSHGGDLTINSNSITGGSSTVSTATVNIGATEGFFVGSLVNVQGVSPSGYNGAFTVTAVVLNTSVTMNNTANPAGWSSAGTISLTCNNALGTDDSHLLYLPFVTQAPMTSSMFGTATSRHTYTADMVIWTGAVAPGLYLSAEASQFSTLGTVMWSPNALSTVGTSLSHQFFSATWGVTVDAANDGKVDTAMTAATGSAASIANNNFHGLLPITLSNVNYFQVSPYWRATGLKSGICNDAGNKCGFSSLACATNDVITLGTFNNSCVAATAATVACTGTNAIANGTAIVVTNTGISCTSGTALTASGTCAGNTCTGSAAITGVLGGPQGEALQLLHLAVQ